MDYENENWIKVYTRDTASWLAKSWQARGLALELARHMEKATGEISLGSKGLPAVAALLRAPWDEIEAVVQELILEGDLEYDAEEQVLRDPEHPARQGAVASPALRKRQERERATARDAMSRAVTRGHAKSLKKEREKEEKESETRARAEPDDEPEPEDAPDRSPLDAPMPAWVVERLRTIAHGHLLEPEQLFPAAPIVWSKFVATCLDDGRPVSEPGLYRYAAGWAMRELETRKKHAAAVARAEAEREAAEQRRERAARGTMSPPVRSARDAPPGSAGPPPSAAELAAGLALIGGGAAP